MLGSSNSQSKLRRPPSGNAALKTVTSQKHINSPQEELSQTQQATDRDDQ